MTKEPTPPQHFEAGDIFYTGQGSEFYVSKLLMNDEAFNAYHVTCYLALDHEPTLADLPHLRLLMMHAPIDRNGFTNPKLLAKSELSDDDLEGYREYIRQTNNIEELVRLAKQYYTAAYYLSDEGKHEAAIAKYTLAIELIPNFFEAIDNLAFSKMDMGRWENAIVDFELSLSVAPNSVLAEFSIGECYLRLKNGPKAVAQFEKVLALEPNNAKGKEFLARAKSLS